MNMNTRKNILAAILTAVLISTCGFARGAGNLQQALDKPFDFSISDVPIKDVFDKLSKETGVNFIVDRDTLDYLPYGDQTRMVITVKNATIRRDLSSILAYNALRWVIDGSAIRIIPTDALYRLCRRATYSELKTLGTMYTFSVQNTDANNTIIGPLARATGEKKLSLRFADGKTQTNAIKNADTLLPCTPVKWMNALCKNADKSWYLDGSEIIVLDRKKQVNRQLNRKVSLRYQNAELVQVLLDLARKALVKLEMEPGLLNQLPARVRSNFSLIMPDTTISQALEVISGATGLAFIPNATSIEVTISGRTVSVGADDLAPQTKKKSAFYVEMSIKLEDGTSVKVFFRSEELPEHIVKAILKEKENRIKQLEKHFEISNPPIPE